MDTMKPERWQQIKAAFEAAVERAPAERQRRLDQMCAGETLSLPRKRAVSRSTIEATSFRSARVVDTARG